jgi:hypothetical protein
MTKAEEYKASPVKKVGSYPGWLRKMLVKRYGREEVAEGVDPFRSGGWVDHAGRAMVHGAECFVSEPYGLTEEKTRNLVAVTGELGLKFSIDAASFHYPGRTIRVVIWPPGYVEKC